MTLASIVIPRADVSFRGTTLSVRGLALNDVSVLIRGYLAEINKLFDLFEREDTQTALGESARLALTVVQEAPNIVGQVIVLAMDEPQEQIKVAERLPLPTQVELVRKIIELTFEEAGGAKKFFDTVMSMVVRPMRVETA